MNAALRGTACGLAFRSLRIAELDADTPLPADQYRRSPLHCATAELAEGELHF
jgi:hypothetical protein